MLMRLATNRNSFLIHLKGKQQRAPVFFSLILIVRNEYPNTLKLNYNDLRQKTNII